MHLAPSRIFILLLIFLCTQSTAQRSIDSSRIITIGGIKQFVAIKGKDVSKPLLLILHGGPGGSLLKRTDQISGKLQEHFVVVQWDQRETGETLALNKSPEPLKLDLFYNDTRELIDSLLKQFQRPKLYLIGYSWGSGLGFHIAQKYPDRLYAYIAVSPVINQWKSETMALTMLRETMGNKARRELAQVKIPYENPDQLYYQRKWLLKHEGKKFLSITFRKSFLLGWAATWFPVWLKSCDVNLFNTLPAINCPVYFFAGKRDFNTNYSITGEYFIKVYAPKKDYFLFEDAGHGLPETHSARFQEIIITQILPATLE